MEPDTGPNVPSEVLCQFYFAFPKIHCSFGEAGSP